MNVATMVMIVRLSPLHLAAQLLREADNQKDAVR